MISTHTPLAGRDIAAQVITLIIQISTHTPLAGRDPDEEEDGPEDDNFYSHAPRGT